MRGTQIAIMRYFSETPVQNRYSEVEWQDRRGQPTRQSACCLHVRTWIWSPGPNLKNMLDTITYDCKPVILTLGRCREEVPGGCWPASLAELASSTFTEKPCVKIKRCRMTREDMWHWSLASPCMHTCMYTHEHARPPTSMTGARISNGKMLRLLMEPCWERALAMVSRKRQMLSDSQLLSVDTHAHAARDLPRDICHLRF